ncbi:MAG TPA: hypothetical protein VFG76_02995 [Candidatus Polarisedimenticolia bacterium]|nr:hypothetical protein [Candidatus Polarisedimenticolia bacterium]
MREKPLIGIILPTLALLTFGCLGQAFGPTQCDGLAGQTLAITRSDYSKCAGEILGTLDELEKSLNRFVGGDAAAKDPAVSASRKLAHLISEAGLQADAWREVKGGSGRTVERWPDASMRGFNAQVINAAAQFNAVLAYPNQDNLQQGARLHADARSSYSQFR